MGSVTGIAVMAAVIGITIAMGIAAAVLAVKYSMLKYCLRQARQDLAEMMQNPQENRLLLSPCPSREAERLFAQINSYIQLQQKERINWQRQELLLREQIENISHDLRTPLTAILGYLELVNREKMSAEDQEAMAIVEKKSRYLQRLIGDFYDLSRLERADVKLELKPVEITRLIRETVLAYYPQLTQKQLEVELLLPEAPVMICGDRETVERILQNMLQNALRYARSCFQIRVYDERQAEEHRICVDFCNDTDQLTQLDIPHLFERFYTADCARSGGSTGLGLTISGLLAKAMGGRATAALSEQGMLHIIFSFVKTPCSKVR